MRSEISTKKNGRWNKSSARILGEEIFNLNLFLLLQKRKSGPLVLGDFITGWKCIKSTLFGLATEIVESHFLTTTKFLKTMVKEIGLSAFFANDAECHSIDPVGVCWDGRFR
jgi:hypothetical protein